jgi:hypothetical protein
MYHLYKSYNYQKIEGQTYYYYFWWRSIFLDGQ